jgi:DNA-binding transcriptional MocR family regulator
MKATVSWNLARRMDRLKASDIREILKVTQRPEVISFAGGLPAPEFFPAAALAGITRDLLEQEGARALQYSTTEGHPELREHIARRLNRLWGTAERAEDVLITTGSQQGLDLIGKLLLDEGDAVLCESPTYLGAISAWEVFGPRWLEVPTDDQGMDLEALAQRLRGPERIKLIYTVPNFQNPTGRTWSLERRRGLMELATRHGIPVIEDNPYGELRFAGERLPALKSFDPDGLVIGLGTFSKVFCPGLRLAWLTAGRGIYEKLVILKQGTDLHSSTLHQMQMSRYLDSHDLDQDVARITEVYRARRQAMVAALEAELPAGVRFTRPEGGLFLWLELPERLSGRTLLQACLRRDVAFVPGGAFFPNGGHENTLRLNYSNMPPERIQEGVRRLAAAIRELL